MTGVLASVVEEPYIVEVPERFRFSDENPLTLVPYSKGRFGDLPPYVEDVITDVVGLSGAEWDALVDAGEVYSVVGPHRSYSLSTFLQSVRKRGTRGGPKHLCGDCWGTLAVHDSDGSLTGRVGAVCLCYCATGQEPSTAFLGEVQRAWVSA